MFSTYFLQILFTNFNLNLIKPSGKLHKAYSDRFFNINVKPVETNTVKVKVNLFMCL
jgi:hypothetical protein